MAEKYDGFNDLALVIQKRIGKVSENPPVLDFGVINPDWSLRTNGYPIDIPANDYLICNSLLEHDCICESAIVGDHGGHIHGVAVKRRFNSGVRVLVAWIGNDAVVVDIIRPATEGL